ncbi:MAG: tRNA wybutosine-synthesizing 3 family protein [Nanoarchaeota archaeon]|nr:tRNA wybutosine-synthesizing 3 family protein [Nanoarchaeota archaeon]
MNFQNNKKVCLDKIDKSVKASIDSKILKLVDCINNNEHFYTTSSCSGRVVLQNIAESGRKNENLWLFVSHDIVEYSELLKTLETVSNIEKLSEGDEVWFRMEAAILHVACDSLENAQKLVDFARNSGFRRSGIQSTNKKILVEIVGSERMDIPVYYDAKLLISAYYVREMIRFANYKLNINWAKIEKLKEFFRNY